MKRLLCVVTVLMILTVNAFAAATEYGSAELSEAISIMEECGGDPGQNELERLYGLGLSDEDIDGLTVVSSLRKDKIDFTPYIVIIAAAIMLSAAVICAVKLCREKK